MVKRFFESYHEVPDGTQCHRKTYITTALGGICGERGPVGGRRAEVWKQRSEGARRSLGRRGAMAVKAEEVETFEGRRLVSA
jgi:hypothetical protein